ncbi:MAG: PP2C family protein-serine/threonine phosphatase [Porcipelethomonas sp.]
MKFTTAVHTDVGIRKKTNQDSVLVMKAETDYGHVIMSVVCDGMGGLSKGELASATIVREFKQWFSDELRGMLSDSINADALFERWNNIIQNTNEKIADYGRSIGVRLGSTLVIMLIAGNQYFIMNVGDSRTYKFSDNVYQLTKDQTYVQREMDLGRMTPEQARTDPQRNVLLQCIGASEVIIPDTYIGTVSSGDVFMMCSDGFRHVIMNEEFYQRFNPAAAVSQEALKEALVYFTELNKYRREDDNISAVVIRAD